MRPSSLALVLLSLPATAGTAVFEVVGTVASASVNNGPFVGTTVGMPARLTYHVTTPGTDVNPGHVTTFSIVASSVVLTIGPNSTGSTAATPTVTMRNQDFTVDGVFQSGLALTGTSPVGFSFSDCNGASFTSTDPLANVGTYSSANWCVYDWVIQGPGIFLEMLPATFTISELPPGAPFCFGDGLDTTHTTPCPCANTGSAGHGCANSVNAAGALLTASGELATDTVVLEGSGMPATVACIYLQGDALADTTFGDGVRCAGGTLLRLRTKVNSGGASAFPDSTDTVTLSQRGGVVVGSGVTRQYQTYYRNSAGLFCPPETFNVTNGYAIVW
ncbi:MAG: hypothetical protein IPJ77_13015 [Planctomycetes bacterium]|nr:hypothetical protein [Planctomycetota bacterium]